VAEARLGLLAVPPEIEDDAGDENAVHEPSQHEESERDAEREFKEWAWVADWDARAHREERFAGTLPEPPDAAVVREKYATALKHRAQQTLGKDVFRIVRKFLRGRSSGQGQRG
jgi:hypothetical protein